MRKIIKKIHLYVGLITGLIVFITSLSGSLYSFEEEFRDRMYKDFQQVQIQDSRLSLEQLIDSAKAGNKKLEIRNIFIKNNSSASVEVMYKNKASLYIDPYTGKKLGSIDKGNDFFGKCLKLHRSLFLGEVGKTIVGINCLLFLIMLISGIVIWIPKKRIDFKQLFFFKSEATFKRKIFDWHRLPAFYVSIILLLSIITGLIMSFKWAENTMYFLSGSKKEKREKIESTPLNVDAKSFSLETIIAELKKGKAIQPDCFIGLPEDEKGVYRITLRSDEGGFFKRIDQYTIDQYSGKILKEKPFEKMQAGEKIRSVTKDVHTGKSFGLFGEIVVFITGLVSASLPITGFLIWWNKQKLKAA